MGKSRGLMCESSQRHPRSHAVIDQPPIRRVLSMSCSGQLHQLFTLNGTTPFVQDNQKIIAGILEIKATQI